MTTRGVEFDAVNLQDRPDEVEALALAGMGALPVVVRDDRYVMGANLADVDALLELDGRVTTLLTGEELVDRTTRLLTAASRYTLQLPRDHYDDPIPGMEDVHGPLLLADGTPVLTESGAPYVPHRTSLGLVRHLAGHGAKFTLLAEDRAGAAYTSMAAYLPLGEPPETHDAIQLADGIETSARDVARWWRATRGARLDVVLATFWGTHTLQKVLNDNTYSLAQHTRQLMTVLRDLGIAPQRPLTDADVRGIALPERIWD